MNTKFKAIRAVLLLKEKDITTKPVHVIFIDNKWKVIISTHHKALKVEDHRELAFLHACNIAEENQKIIIHNEDGSVKFEFEMM